MSQLHDLYVIGPVSGHKNDNREEFEKARSRLRACGYTVLIPHDVIPTGMDWAPAMWISIATMLTRAKAVAILDGPLSQGSTIELGVCLDTRKPHDTVSGWERRATKQPAWMLGRRQAFATA